MDESLDQRKTQASFRSKLAREPLVVASVVPTIVQAFEGGFKVEIVVVTCVDAKFCPGYYVYF